MDIANIQIEVDTAPIRAATEALDALAEAAGRAKKALDTLEGRGEISVVITDALQSYDRQLSARIQRIAKDPRAR